MKNYSGIRHKINKAMILVTVCTVIMVGGVFFGAVGVILYNIVINEVKLQKRIEKLSSETMDEQTSARIKSVAFNNAIMIDNFLENIEADVRVIADAASMAYEDESAYTPRKVDLPDKKNGGKLMAQLVFTKDANPEDPKVQREIGLLGNLQDLMLAENINSKDIASNCVATETGIMIWTDTLSDKKFNKNGNIRRYDPDKRTWYMGTKKKERTYFTQVSIDEHTNKKGILCSEPIFSHNEFKGVAVAAIYLDDIEAIVNNSEMGELSEEYILGKNGDVLFSNGEVRDFSGISIKQKAKESGIFYMEIDNKLYYICRAPIKSMGWTYVVMFPGEKVDAPTKELLNSISNHYKYIDWQVDEIIITILMLVLGIIIAVVLAVIIAGKRLSFAIARPIIELTQKVSNMDEDTLEFVWEENTEDETQFLADSFKDLTERVKRHILEVQRMTAEKKSIEAELNVAARIQSDMLPKVFPAFPDRKEFDIYASMDPAKEVGGDFYDFFLLDEDHLAIVMADVSGKGVPAALFMALSKTLIKNEAKMNRSPVKILREVNKALCEGNDQFMFVTVYLAIMEISTGKVVASNAGHEYPALRGKSGRFELVEDKHGEVVGLMDDAEYMEYEFTLDEGECLFIFTDGVPEANNAEKKFFGLERMLEALNKEPFCEPKQLLKNVKDSVDEFVDDAEQFDDLTMLALARR